VSIRSSRTIGEFVGNPFLLTLLCRLIEDGRVVPGGVKRLKGQPCIGIPDGKQNYSELEGIRIY